MILFSSPIPILIGLYKHIPILLGLYKPIHILTPCVLLDPRHSKILVQHREFVVCASSVQHQHFPAASSFPLSLQLVLGCYQLYFGLLRVCCLSKSSLCSEFDVGSILFSIDDDSPTLKASRNCVANVLRLVKLSFVS